MADSAAVPHMMIRAGELHDRAVVRQKLLEIADRKLAEFRGAAAALAPHPVARACEATLRDLTWVDVAVETYAAVAAETSIAAPRAVQAALGTPGTVIFEGA